MPQDIADQKRHFDSERNQYSLDALANPPLHTRMEEQRIVDRLQDLPTDARILDFGAGTGRISFALARAGRPVIAMDISEDSLTNLNQTAQHLGVHGITTTTKLPVGAVDAVVGADVFHHVPLAEILPQIAASLKPGGRLVFSEPGGFHPFWYLYHTCRRAMWIERRNITMNRWWLRKKLEDAGFTDIEIRGVGVVPRPLAAFNEQSCAINDAAGNLPVVNWFAYRYLISATRGEASFT